MKTRNVQLNSQRLLVVGPIYNRTDKLFLLDKLCKPDDRIVFLGDVSLPYKSKSEVTKRIQEIQAFSESHKSFYVLGDEDLLFMKDSYVSHADAYDWFNQQSITIRFTYKNNSNVMVVHGGIPTKNKTLESLDNDLELIFESKSSNAKKKWHKTYDGRFGYVVSSHPPVQSDKAEIHNHSMSLDSQCHTKEVLLVQEVNDKGLGETFSI